MFIPVVKEAESRLKCTSDVNYRESIEENNFLPLLSDREKDVLICVAKGMTYIPASIHNEAMLSGAWTSIAQ